MEEICGDVWGGQDYVPGEWVAWSANPDNQLYLVEINGRPAGAYNLRLNFVAPDSGWVQAVRVSSTFRRQNVAAAIIEHAIETCRAQGLKALCYVTAEENAPMHRLAQRYDFRHVGNFLSNYYAQTTLPKPAVQPYRLVTTSEFDGAYNLVSNSPEYQATESLYSVAWHWKSLSIDALRQHIERREVYSLTGMLKALAILTRDEYEENSYWLSYLAGEEAARVALLQELTRKVAALTPPDQPINFSVLLPQTGLNEAALQQANFVPSEHEAVLWLYELGL